MSVKVLVVYPNDEGATFNMDYYLSTHMPLVTEKWKQYGLKGWEVIQFAGGPDGSKPQFSTQATLIWDNKDDFFKAVGAPETKDVMEDISNFSNKQPLIIGGKVLKTESL